ncbi:hypothetical protein [Glycomyces sp. YM15]|uniref:hypothetical protein n=1 Tax=Glycomyces sp. YM15 TaxID=2800446 RepID=UPI001966180B|nr:hypothetical protein [Glycomyces sp. YM15]
MTSSERVTRSDFRVLHPIAAPKPLSELPERIWSDEDWERLQHGFRAREMEEKWNVFTEGDVVYLHRSWTGFGVFAATFAAAPEGGRRIVRAEVERDPERYRGDDDEHDSLTLEIVLTGTVLGESTMGLFRRMREMAEREHGSD